VNLKLLSQKENLMNNRTKLSLIVLMAVIFAIFIPSVFAADNGVKASSEFPVNVRSGPGQEYTVRGVLYSGTLNVTGRNDFETGRVCHGNPADLDMWLRVEFKGVEGWISRCAMTIDGEVDGLSISSASTPVLVDTLKPFELQTAVEDVDVEPAGAHVLGFTSARVNLRDSASLSGKVLSVLTSGEDVYVIGRTTDDNWVQITQDGQTGWIARYLMQLPHDWQKTVPMK
jgi:uncharacterized protein YraI